MLIYKITNIVNGKFYIGKTTKSIEERFRRHTYNLKYKNKLTYLYKSFKKYGIDKFTIEHIDSATSIKELNDKEIYWINLLKPQYNLTSGGEGGDTSSSENWKKAFLEGRTRPKTLVPSYGMLGKAASPEMKLKISKANSNMVSVYGVIYQSIGEAQKFNPHISIRKRLDSKHHPDIFRITPKRKYKTT